MENPREVKMKMMLKVDLAVNCDKLIDLSYCTCTRLAAQSDQRSILRLDQSGGIPQGWCDEELSYDTAKSKVQLMKGRWLPVSCCGVSEIT